MAGSLGLVQIKDGNGNLITGQVRFYDTSGTGSGPWVPVQLQYDPTSGNVATIETRGSKTAFAVEILDGSGNQVTSFGGSGGTASNFASAFPSVGTAIGAKNGANMVNLIADASNNLLVGVNTALPAGTNLLGKVGLDQTTPGTTNAVSLAQIGSTTTATGNGVSGAGVQRVAIASDNTAFAVNATLQASASTAIGKVDPNTPANWGIATSTYNSALAANGNLALGQFQTSPGAITTGNMAPLQVDANGNLRVNIMAGAGSGGTAVVDASTFTEGATSLTPIGGVFKTSQTALTNGQAGVVALSAAREMNTLGKVWDGTNTAAVKAANTAATTSDAALCVTIAPASNWLVATGTAGTPASAVITTQGITGGTAMPVLPALTAAANGLTSSRVNAAATTNATSLKASAGNIGRIDVFNTAAYGVFLKLYNKASTPTVGTDTPVWTIPLASGGGFSADFPRGKSFSVGIAYAITKLQADSDTTVVAAGDLTGSIDWI